MTSYIKLVRLKIKNCSFIVQYLFFKGVIEIPSLIKYFH
ncbi:hypothetical protein EMIT0P294_30561 [Pseudomonas sp. IT-P294]